MFSAFASKVQIKLSCKRCKELKLCSSFRILHLFNMKNCCLGSTITIWYSHLELSPLFGLRKRHICKSVPQFLKCSNGISNTPTQHMVLNLCMMPQKDFFLSLLNFKSSDSPEKEYASVQYVQEEVAYYMTNFPALKLLVVVQRFLHFLPSQQTQHQLIKILLLLQEEKFPLHLLS